MVVGPIQAGLGKALHQPAEQSLMPDVHPYGHLRLFAVPPERGLADEQTDDDAVLEL